MRDRLTHAYFGVDLGLICRVVERDLQPLESAVTALPRRNREQGEMTRLLLTNGPLLSGVRGTEILWCNRVQGATATLAFRAVSATWFLQVADSLKRPDGFESHPSANYSSSVTAPRSFI